MVPENGNISTMREIVFRVIKEQPGRIEARADAPPITITAASLEELHHEAREALIQHLGPAHVSVRARIRRGQAHSCRPWHRRTVSSAA
mgnify:CR=1 FL=1|jgi:hypothetical protein